MKVVRIHVTKPAAPQIRYPAGIGLREEAMGYRERIRLLQENSSIVNSSFEFTYTFTPSVCFFEQTQPPKTVTNTENANCFGTVVWVLGVEKQVEWVWHRAIRASRSFEATGTGDYMALADGRPGYIGAEPIRAFLRFSRDVELVKNAQEGDIVTQWYSNPHDEECGFRIRHCGIILSDGLVFEKEGWIKGIKSSRVVSDLAADVPSTAKRMHTWLFRVIVLR